tara:strand:+ start:202 stop:684 length:483 start_codon:yes stop_codon:yes gene_type:complete
MAEFTFENGNQIYQRTRLELGPLYLSAQSYKEISNKLSKIYVSASPITSISFTADESFPEEYITDNSSAKDFISYYLVINNKDYAIAPGNRGGDDPTMIYINSEMSEEAREELKQTEKVGFIDIADKVTTWQLRARLKRPSNMPESTPVITSYRFTYTYE